MAEDLPRTKLSEHLEKHIREKLKERQDSEVQAKMAENEVRLLFVFNFVFSSRKGVSN
jgi:hypothetical protein